MTVRLGSKWLRHFSRGVRKVALLDGEGEPIGHAELEKVAYVRFSDIPESWLIQQHDPYCTLLADLYDTMREVYANAALARRCKEMGPNDYVTVVWFRPELF